MKVTRRSMLTGQQHTLEVPCSPEQLYLFQTGVAIQRVMPSVPAELREFVMTGITPDEWNRYVKGDNDE